MTHFVSGNRIKLLRNGAEYFPALEAAITSAAKEIYLQTYIYQADATGMLIGNALKHAAQRGVHVHVLLDGFGCKDLPKTYVHELERAGVQVMFYRPKISPWTFKKNRLRRLHRKVAVIDGTIGFVGGINIIDDYDIPKSHTPFNVPPRVDYAVHLEGALLPAIAESVHKLWRHHARLHLLSASMDPAKPIRQRKIKDGIKAAFVLRDNLLHRRDIEDAYLEAIAQAKSEIIIANAYFVPGKRFRQALLDAAQRGVAVKLLLQGRMEYFLMFAAHAFYNEFLRHGIEIYEYRKSFMHSKVAVIDNAWATVGSSNIDPFSLLLAREANVIVLDAAFANELRADILASTQEGAHRVAEQDWGRGNIVKRIASWVAYGLVRFFLGVIGYSNER
ncbi:MAG TPA: cardiolipin synthase ClsB [Methylotenera sp.]|nr:cardiolipin synthase ClsB [Methylotenera sp.]HPV44689.1 cardiolipin synthase ClsB [Methylotenera sp.]